MQVLIVLFILYVGSQAAALRCTDWIDHVKTEHQIYFRKKTVSYISVRIRVEAY